MTLSLISIAWRLKAIALLHVLLLWPSTIAFAPLPTNTYLTTARSVGVPLEMDPTFVEAMTASSMLISAAKATTASAVSGSSTTVVTSGASGSSAVLKFFAGSAVFIGIVGTFKWNNAESSEQIRESWEKLVDSTSAFGTAPPEPHIPRMESSVVSESPTTEVPVPVATPAAKDVAVPSATSKPMPNAKEASSPQDLINMMKDVGDATEPKKKRFIVRLLKKVVMPWRKWSNL